MNDYIMHDDHLAITWEDGTVSRYHWVWLRDFCRCEHCFNRNCQQKYFDCATIPVDIAPSAIEQQESALSVLWPDGHRSSYVLTWLRNHDYSNAGIESSTVYPARKTWDRPTLMKSLNDFHFTSLLHDDDVLLAYLTDLLTYGIVILRDIEGEDGFMQTVGRVAGFVDKTYFGDVYDLVVKPTDAMDSVSFSTNTLPLHTDIPYYDQPPAFQFLFGVDVSENAAFTGRTLFADGLHVARIFRREYPHFFDLLSTTKVMYRAQYPWVQKDYVHKTSIINIDAEGEITFVNNPTKMFFLDIPFSQMKAYYQAYSAFKHLLSKPRHIYAMAWHRGDMVLYDNRRIFHGREAFDDPSVRRIIRGGYFGNAELTSRYFHLKHRALENVA